jgi:hypothetical protein
MRASLQQNASLAAANFATADHQTQFAGNFVKCG